MQTSTKLLAPLMAAPLAIAMAAPASAGPNNGWSETRQAPYARQHRDRYSDPRIERRLDRISREIRQARRSGELSRYEARILRQKLRTAERGYHAFARNGLSRRDIRVTMRRISNVRQDLSDRRYRYDRRARYDDRRTNRRGYR
ncbi:hypothetical protein [Pontixanthobacter sp. CEM42]|uniref:hypothetical protein n=1 Tax=Pontixanthobacter sp. CEM42 TaxID=2792077 RepID=UPI001AE0269D|nr:hypothetical protein [Pontixanthobacter sp. CEM42]